MDQRDSITHSMTHVIRTWMDSHQDLLTSLDLRYEVEATDEEVNCYITATRKDGSSKTFEGKFWLDGEKIQTNLIPTGHPGKTWFLWIFKVGERDVIRFAINYAKQAVIWQCGCSQSEARAASLALKRASDRLKTQLGSDYTLERAQQLERELLPASYPKYFAFTQRLERLSLALNDSFPPEQDSTL